MDLALALKVIQNHAGSLMLNDVSLQLLILCQKFFKASQLLLDGLLLESGLLLLLMDLSFCPSALLTTAKHLEAIAFGDYKSLKRKCEVTH